MTRAGIVACLMLTACVSGSHWRKPGTDNAAAQQAYAACRGAARGALTTDRHIDQDILASRGADWQRSHTSATQRETMRVQAASHVDAVIAACMHAHGFSQE